MTNGCFDAFGAFFSSIEGEGSPWLQPNVIPAVILEGRSPDRIMGNSLRLPRTPTAGLKTL